MKTVYGYLAEDRMDGKRVVAVLDGNGYALCISLDKHWTYNRPWDRLHIIAPLVKDEGNDDPNDDLDRMRRERDAAVERADESEQKAQRYSDKFNRARSFNVEMKARAEKAERERDAAVARAEAAEKRHTWPKVTPTGHTYVEPRTYEALRHEHDNAAQAAVESWDADECPPEPTWEMVGIAHREVERLQRDRDEWKARAEAAERERDEATERAEHAQRKWENLRGTHERLVREYQLQSATWGQKRDAYDARLADQSIPAVTRDDIEKAIRGKIQSAHPEPNEAGFHRVRIEWATDAVWALIQGDDPAVFVVRESDIAAVKVEQDEGGDWEANGDLVAMRQNTAEALRGWSLGELQVLARYEAVARAIEAEQAVDPVEDRARDLWESTRSEGAEVARWEEAHEFAQDQFRILARHVLAQEARDE